MATLKIEGERPFKDIDGEALVNEISSLLRDQKDVKFAYLFGSRASGYHRPDSDVDLGVFWSDGVSSWSKVGLEEDLSDRMGVPVRIISLQQGLRPGLLRSILSNGVVVKDSNERKGWEEETYRRVKEAEMAQKGDHRKEALDSLDEKMRRIIKALPLLEEVDLEKVKQDEPRAVRDFIGAFFMVFEPLETIARKMSNYAHEVMGLELESNTLRDRMKLTVGILGLDDEVSEELGKLVELRGRIAHAYWKLSEDDDALKLNLDRVKSAINELISKLSLFIIEERGKAI